MNDLPFDPKTLHGVPGWINDDTAAIYGFDLAYFVVLPIDFPAKLYGLHRDDIFWSYTAAINDLKTAEEHFLRIKREGLPVRGVVRVSRHGGAFELNNADLEDFDWPGRESEGFGSW